MSDTASCESCGGRLKPDVVFFGESVPKPRVEASFAHVDAADALLVAGSSLTVMSGLRFVRHARRRDLPNTQHQKTLIAATALRHQATLVTRNVREFGRVANLQCLNWHAEGVA